MTRPRFIDDLIPLVLDAENHWWPRDLTKLAPVSPSWLYYVRKSLYSYPQVASFTAIQRLARTLEENESLQQLVTALWLRPEEKRRPWFKDLAGLRRLLGVAGCRRLTLGGDLAIGAEKYLKLVAYPEEVEEICIDGSGSIERFGVPGGRVEWDESIGSRFTKLRRLRLAEVDLEINPSSTGWPLSIRRLVLNNVYLSGSLTDLLNGSRTLRELHVSTKEESTVYDEEIGKLLQECQIECLHYTVEEDKQPDRFVLDVETRNAGSLSCLHLAGVAMDLGALGVIREKYSNVVELVVDGGLSAITVMEWAEFVEASWMMRRARLPWKRWSSEDVKTISESLRLRNIASM